MGVYVFGIRPGDFDSASARERWRTISRGETTDKWAGGRGGAEELRGAGQQIWPRDAHSTCSYRFPPITAGDSHPHSSRPHLSQQSIPTASAARSQSRLSHRERDTRHDKCRVRNARDGVLFVSCTRWLSDLLLLLLSYAHAHPNPTTTTATRHAQTQRQDTCYCRHPANHTIPAAAGTNHPAQPAAGSLHRRGRLAGCSGIPSSSAPSGKSTARLRWRPPTHTPPELFAAMHVALAIQSSADPPVDFPWRYVSSHPIPAHT